jgi:hypothetical protein
LDNVPYFPSFIPSGYATLFVKLFGLGVNIFFFDQLIPLKIIWLI